jgi:hypothetical protein
MITYDTGTKYVAEASKAIQNSCGKVNDGNTFSDCVTTIGANMPQVMLADKGITIADSLLTKIPGMPSNPTRTAVNFALQYPKQYVGLVANQSIANAKEMVNSCGGVKDASSFGACAGSIAKLNPMYIMGDQGMQMTNTLLHQIPGVPKDFSLNKEAASYLSKYPKEGVNTLVSKGVPIFNSIANAISNGIPDVASQFGKDVIGVTKDASGTINGVITNQGAYVAGTAVKGGYQIRDVAVGTGNKIANITSDAGKAIIGGLSDTGSKIVDVGRSVGSFLGF